jgi:Kef-type K+ transport system membrane component KefB
MFGKYLYITKIFLFLLYVITPLYIFMYAQSKSDYLIAIVILIIGFLLNYLFSNGHKRKVREFMLKWF